MARASLCDLPGLRTAPDCRRCSARARSGIEWVEIIEGHLDKRPVRKAV